MTLWISQQVVAAICSDGARLHPLETGGVLLGWRDGGDLVVVGLIGAGHAAMHGRTAFLPDHRWQSRHLAEAFAASEGDLDYVGDWHTHPDGPAAMSGTDRATLRRIERRVRRPAMLIAAYGVEGWQLAGWTWTGRRPFRPGAAEMLDVKPFVPPADWPRLIRIE